jgi:hypothetical protein
MLTTGTTDLADASVALRCRTSGIEQVATVECSFKSLRDHVPVGDVAAHLKLVGKMRDNLSYSFDRPEPSAAPGQGFPMEAWMWLGGAVVVGLTLFVGVPFAFRVPRIMKKRAFTRRLVLSGGEAPATAIPVASLDDLRRHLARSRCACGAPPTAAEPELAELRLGDRKITSARVVCASCGEARKVYYEVKS